MYITVFNKQPKWNTLKATINRRMYNISVPYRLLTDIIDILIIGINVGYVIIHLTILSVT